VRRRGIFCQGKGRDESAIDHAHRASFKFPLTRFESTQANLEIRNSGPSAPNYLIS
jgi:hypothetical protein